MSAYAEKLKDPRWQKKRLEILSRDNWSCYWCGDTESTLHVHHTVYVGENPWDTWDECLLTLCEGCHSVHHLKLSELELFLIGCIRCRDKGDMEAIKLLNKFVTRVVNQRQMGITDELLTYKF